MVEQPVDYPATLGGAQDAGELCAVQRFGGMNRTDGASYDLDRRRLGVDGFRGTRGGVEMYCLRLLGWSEFGVCCAIRRV